MPIFDPNTGFAICKDCVKDIYNFIEEHEAASVEKEKLDFAGQLDEILKKNKPHIIKAYLDEYIINQDRAKKILSVEKLSKYQQAEAEFLRKFLQNRKRDD